MFSLVGVGDRIELSIDRTLDIERVFAVDKFFMQIVNDSFDVSTIESCIDHFLLFLFFGITVSNSILVRYLSLLLTTLPLHKNSWDSHIHTKFVLIFADRLVANT